MNQLLLWLMIITGVLACIRLVVVMTRPSNNTVNDSANANDLTGSNANFGRSLMGDNDNFGKGL